MPYKSGVIVLVSLNHSPDYSLNCTPLSPITITNHTGCICVVKTLTETGIITIIHVQSNISVSSCLTVTFLAVLRHIFISCFRQIVSKSREQIQTLRLLVTAAGRNPISSKLIG